MKRSSSVGFSSSNFGASLAPGAGMTVILDFFCLGVTGCATVGVSLGVGSAALLGPDVLLSDEDSLASCALCTN